MVFTITPAFVGDDAHIVPHHLSQNKEAIMKKCNVCWAESYRVESRFCLKCGSGLPDHYYEPDKNICTNRSCDWHRNSFIYPDDARFCDVCGSKTVFAG